MMRIISIFIFKFVAYKRFRSDNNTKYEPKRIY
jgi:hypothetical protein